MRQIGLESDHAKGHISYYFRNKQDLLFEIVDDLFERTIQGIRVWAAEPDLTDRERLHHVVYQNVLLTCNFHRESRVAHENFRFLGADRRELLRKSRAEYDVILGKVIDDFRAGRRAYSVNTEMLIRVLVAIINSPYEWYRPDGPLSAEQVAAILADRAVAAVEP